MITSITSHRSGGRIPGSNPLQNWWDWCHEGGKTGNVVGVFFQRVLLTHTLIECSSQDQGTWRCAQTVGCRRMPAWCPERLFVEIKVGLEIDRLPVQVS